MIRRNKRVKKEMLYVDCRKEDSIRKVKRSITQRTRIPKEAYYLIYHGKVMENGSTVHENNIGAWDVVEMMYKLYGGKKDEAGENNNKGNKKKRREWEMRNERKGEGTLKEVERKRDRASEEEQKASIGTSGWIGEWEERRKSKKKSNDNKKRDNIIGEKKTPRGLNMTEIEKWMKK